MTMRYIIRENKAQETFLVCRVEDRNDVVVDICNTEDEANHLLKVLNYETQTAAAVARNEALSDIRQMIYTELKQYFAFNSPDDVMISDTAAMIANRLDEAEEMRRLLKAQLPNTPPPAPLDIVAMLTQAIGLITSGNSHAQRNIAALQAINLITDVIRRLLAPPHGERLRDDDIPF